MPEITPGSAFAADYVPQIDWKAQRLAQALSQNSTTTRERLMASDDPEKRLHASGYIPGLSVKSDRDTELARTKQLLKSSRL